MILWRYLISEFLKNIMIITLIISSILLIADIIDLLNSTAHYNLSFFKVALLALYRYPAHIDVLIQFIIVFASFMTMFNKTKNSNLTVLRAAGLSPRQTALPLIVTACILGVIKMTVFSEIVAHSYKQYSITRSHYTQTENNVFTFAEHGSWWMQKDSQNDVTYAFAPNFSKGKNNNTIINDIIINVYDHNNKFKSIIIAPKVIVKKDHWLIVDGILFNQDSRTIKLKNYRLPTSLNQKRIFDTLMDVSILSVFQLPAIIKKMHKINADTTEYYLRLFVLLAAPLNFVALTLIGIACNSRNYRGRNYTYNLIAVILIAFIYFTFNKIIHTFVTSYYLTPWQGVLTPIILALIITSLYIISKEEN